MTTTDARFAETRSGYELPLVLAVTGHRDLVAAELGGIRDRVRALFTDLRKRYPERSLSIMSALAEGADRLVAEVALELGIELVALLPMARPVYEEDFESAESRRQFDALLSQATDVLELPLARENTEDRIATPGDARNRQYAQLGVFLCAHCHILLALWDGKPGDDLGGTGQVVKFHHDDVMPGHISKTVATQQMLVDDESDLVYHVVVARDRPDGKPRDGLEPLDCFWFTKDPETPISRDLLPQHQLIFDRSSEFSRDAVRYADRIEAEKYPLYSDDDASKLPRGVDDINRLFCIADWLAIHFQKRTLLTLRISHVLAFLMGMMFILYADYESWPWYMFAFLLFFTAAAALQQLEKRRGWQRKYLDYRTLAEGLRVQFYWAAAGVTNENESKFVHDNFLQAQDPELGWIRNVMRIAGTRCDVRPDTSQDGLEFVLKEWIGDADSGQLGYFRKTAAARIRRNRFTESLGLASLLTSVMVVMILVFAGTALPDEWFDPLMLLMGTMLLIFGVRQGYAYATAEKDLIKQYEFMLRIFNNARRRLEHAVDSAEQRQILQALGGSALDEHAEWILTHRDRSLDESEIWHMSG